MSTETLSAAEITYSVAYVAKTKRDDWECDHWRVTLSPKTGKPFETDYYTGLGHRSPAPKPSDGGPPPYRNTLMWHDLEAQRKPIAPSAESVMESLVSDAECATGTFEDFCGEFGYDTDSRKALDTYLACQHTRSELRRLFRDLYGNLVAEAQEN